MRAIQFRSGRPGFKTRLLFALAIAIAVVLLALFVIAAVAIVLVAVPALLLAGIAYLLLPRHTARTPRATTNGEIVEGRYQVIDRSTERD